MALPPSSEGLPARLHRRLRWGRTFTVAGFLLVVVLSLWLVAPLFNQPVWLGQVSGTISAPSGAGIVEYDPMNGQIYLATTLLGQPREVSVLDPASGAIERQVPIVEGALGAPVGMALDPRNGLLFVAVSDGNVTVINGTSDQPVGSFSLPCCLRALTFDAADDELYVSGVSPAYFSTGSEGNVSVVDPQTHAIVASLRVGDDPDSVAVDPASGNVYVANAASDNVSVIDPETERIARTVPLAGEPGGLAYDPMDGDVYVFSLSRGGNSNVSVVDGTTGALVGSVAVPDTWVLSDVVYDSANGYVYTGCQCGGGSLLVIQGTTATALGTLGGVAAVPSGDATQFMAFDGGNNDLYVGGEAPVVTVVSPYAPAPGVPSVLRGIPYGGDAFFGLFAGLVMMMAGAQWIRYSHPGPEPSQDRPKAAA